ncbi:MAG: hypothetical protein SF187_28065 [Deltaproteobacteria bacterium]|nr:hypothetical protein [Deltaproteobacteria bacterium]
MRSQFAHGVPMVLLSTLVIAACSSSSNPSDDNGSGGGGSDAGGAAGMEDKAGMGGASSSAGGKGGSNAGGSAGSASGGASGGQPGTGGMAGAGGVTGTGGAIPATPPAFAIDFENATVGQGPPTPFTGGGPGKAVVDATRAWSGSKSIKVTSSANSTMFNLNVAKYIATNKKTAYARFMLYMDNFPGTMAGGHWDVIKMLGTMRGGDFNVNGFLSFGGFADAQQKLHMFGDDTAGKGRQDCVKQAPMVFEPKKWVCVEMKVDEEDIVNYGISLDGKPIQQYSFLWDSAASNCVPEWNIMQGKWYLPEVNVMTFGFNHVHTQANPVTLWIDDIAVDKKPIGCPQK